MRRSLSVCVLLSLTACGQVSRQDPNNSPSEQAADIAPAARLERSTPDISPTAAPGVAFNYRYAFRLPAERIASVQEQHAAACEKLTIARCRITGMRYRLANDHDIEAMLEFKLDPAIARGFGKAGVQAVTAAEGLLVDSEISGVDAGSAIKSADRTAAQLNDDLKRLEQQIAQPGLRSADRVRLQEEAQRLREQLRANDTSRAEQQESLATTPMVFTYGSGDLVPGFNARSPLRSALKRSSENFLTGFSLLLILTITLLPWLLAGALVWWLVRFVRRRVRPSFQPATATASEAASDSA